MITKIPYDRGYLLCTTGDDEQVSVLSSALHSMRSEGSEEEIVRAALDAPIGAPRLEDWVKGKRSVLIITSDHTRPVPSKITMPQILARLRKGNPALEVKILIATGVHRETTEMELRGKFGDALFEAERDRIFIHRAFEDQMVYLGKLPSGCELSVNALVSTVDAVIAEGFIEPHFFAGYSGGRKSVLPGIASASSVLQNHCAKLIGDPHSRAGVLQGNPLHQDMLAAARLCKLEYIVNVVIDGDKKIVRCFAGDTEAAHEAGCEFVGRFCCVRPAFADIVLTSNGGYPLDQNVYQSIKSMTAAEATVNEGGVIICVSRCGDGSGGEELYRWFSEHKNAAEVAEIIRTTEPKDTVGDQWMAQILARIMLRARVIMVTDSSARAIVEGMKMLWCPTIDDALKEAKKLKPDYGGITIIPDGISVIVTDEKK